MESLLADVTYLTVLSTDAVGRITKKLVLPDILQSFVSENLMLKDCKGDFIVQIVTELLGRDLFIEFCKSEFDISDFRDILLFYHNILTNDVDPSSVFSELNLESNQLYNFIDSRITDIRATLCHMKTNMRERINSKYSTKSGITKLVRNANLSSRKDNVAFSELNLKDCKETQVNSMGDFKPCHNFKSTQSVIDIFEPVNSAPDYGALNDCAGENKIEQEETFKTKLDNSKKEDYANSQEARCSEQDGKDTSQHLSCADILSNVQTENQNFLIDFAGFSLHEKLNELAARIKLELLEEVKDAFFESKYYFRYLQWKGYHYYYKISMSIFMTQRIIGRGGYGEVFGCLKTDTGFLYAIKSQDKKRIKKKHDERGVLTERALLTKLKFPFIVSLVYAFQTTCNLHFIMDLLEGGDLRYNMSTKKNYTEDEIMFYGRQIILTLKYLHSKNIIYRDLKPANVLLDAEGNTKLIDFGLATYCSDMKKSSGAVGTYGYMAPEILEQGYYDYAVDWFSFGCIMFKFVESSSPFSAGRKPEAIIKATLEKEPVFTKACSDNFKKFILDLLKKDQYERAGSQKFPIMQHQFLMDVNWHDVYYKKHKPPVIPDAQAINADDAGSIGMFNDFELRKIKLTEKDQSRYENFYYYDQVKWQEEVHVSQFQSSNEEFWKNSDKMINEFLKFHRVAKQEGCMAYGLLQRKDPFLHLIWSKKLFVVFESYIVIMNSNYSSEKRFPLTDGFCISIIKPEDFTFNIQFKGKRFILRASSETEFQFWMDTLKSHPRFKSNCQGLEKVQSFRTTLKGRFGDSKR